MTRRLSFTLERPESVGPVEVEVSIRNLVVGGWTGRDRTAMEEHIAELEALGVKRPSTLPTYYRCSATCLTQAPGIQVVGGGSSGEVEFLLFRDDGETYVTVASDHTDRDVEAYSVTVSKQMCDKPTARACWAFSDIAGHWDRLVLRAHAEIDGKRVLYQEGAVTAMLHPKDLLAGYGAADGLPPHTAMFGGTFAAIGGIRPATRFWMELEDPILGRSLTHDYTIEELPVAG